MYIYIYTSHSTPLQPISFESCRSTYRVYLGVSLKIYMYVCIIAVYVCTHICVSFTHLHAYIYVYVCVYMYYKYTQKLISILVHTHTNKNIHMHIHRCIHVQVHLFTCIITYLSRINHTLRDTHIHIGTSTFCSSELYKVNFATHSLTHIHKQAYT